MIASDPSLSISSDRRVDLETVDLPQGERGAAELNRAIGVDARARVRTEEDVERVPGREHQRIGEEAPQAIILTGPKASGDAGQRTDIARTREHTSPANDHLTRRRQHAIDLQRAGYHRGQAEILIQPGKYPSSWPVVNHAAIPGDDASIGLHGLRGRRDGQRAGAEQHLATAGPAIDATVSLKPFKLRMLVDDSRTVVVSRRIWTVDAQPTASHARVANVVVAGLGEFDDVADGPGARRRRRWRPRRRSNTRRA